MTNWPWPLGGVQDWFNSLWDTINGWITSGISGLWTTVSSAFDTVKTWITEGFDAAWKTISSAFDTVKTWITDEFSAAWTTISTAFDTVKTWITDGLSAAWAAISSSFNLIEKAVVGWIWWLYDSVSAFFSDLWGKVSAGFTSLKDSVSGFVGDLWAKISTGLSNAATSLVNGLSVAVGTIAGYVKDAIAGALGAVVSGFQNVLGWIWTQLQAIASAIAGAAIKVKEAVSGVLTPVLTGIMTEATKAISAGSPDEEVEKPLQEFSDQLIKRLQELAPKKHESLPDYPALLAATAGVVVAHLGMIFAATSVGTYLDMAHPVKMTGIMTIAEQMLYGINAPATLSPLISSFVWYSITIPLRYRLQAMYPYTVPDPPDMIRFVVREVITPEKFSALMLFHGFDVEVSGWFWEAHWVLPGFGDLRAAWWRGVIQSDQFNAYIVLHDYKPEPRKEGWVSDQAMIAALSYELPGRIDARWMFEQGVIDTEQHLALTKAQGMHPDWAPRVVEAEERAAIRAELEASIRENAAVYAAGRWTEDEFSGMIATLGLGPKLTGFWVARANAMRARKLWLDRLDSLDYAYHYDILTADDYESELKALEVVPDVVAMKVVNQDLRKKGTA